MKPSWSKSSENEREEYTACLQARLQSVQFPQSLCCTDVQCQAKLHSEERDSFVLDMLCAVVETSYTTLPVYGGKARRGQHGYHGTAFPGWSKEVEPYQQEARYWHDNWVLEGRPRGNRLHGVMVKKRAQYHYAIRRTRRRSDLTRAETLFESSLQGDCNLLAEMKKVRCGGSSNHH